MNYRSTLNNWKRSIMVASAIVVSVFCSPRAVLAQDIRVTIDGELVQFQGLGPQQISGRTLVPVRGVLEKLGANVSYNAATQGVVASTPTIDIQLTIGSKNAVVNSHPVTLDVPAQTINDHTFVPLRFLGEALGANIRWDADSRTVVIITKRGDHRKDDADRDHHDRVPPVPQGPAPVITSFSQASGIWLHGGGNVVATMDGTPAGQAMFSIPGVLEEAPMREVSPGHYVGTWQVPGDARLRVRSAAVIGSLTIGTKAAPLIQAGATVSIDTVPPIVRDQAPENMANLNDPRPSISAAFDDDGSGIDKDRVHLLINGRDVTGGSTVTRDFIIYKPDAPLQAGLQQIELRVVDAAGNLNDSRWAFTELSRVAYGIKSVSDNVGRVLQPGDSIHAEMVASAGGQVSFSSGTIQNVPMREDRPGHYVADYTIRRGDDTAGRPLVFHLVLPNGQKFEQMSPHSVRIATGKPAPPIITSPGPGRALSNPLVISGTTSRNTRVHVRVDYVNKVLGVVALQGTAADLIVDADRNGNWQTAPINLVRILSNRGVEYTISATAINGAGELSPTTVLKVHAQ